MNEYRFGSKYIFLMLALCTITSSCKKFFDVPVDKAQVVNEKVYSTDENAIAAMNGVYQTMVNGYFTGGGSNGITALTGLSADEFHSVLLSPDYTVFENNELVADDVNISTLWINAYQIIYQANDIIEEVGRSTGLSNPVKNRLRGEALFVRSFCYFYLVNLFGDVPLVLTPDYTINSKIKRTPVADIYEQTIRDLKEAKMLLPLEYAKPQRTKPNRSAASALLSRFYLYTEQWELAESEATEVIESTQYALEPDLNGVFKIASNETIWQLASLPDRNTQESFLMISYIGSSSLELQANLQHAFEDGDSRRSDWTGMFTDPGTGSELVYWHKYKADFYSSPTTEHYVVLRLAEQFLIRAECRARLGKANEAISDVNEVRTRAELTAIDDNVPTGTEGLLNLILKERRIEFFGEWGHRWFDLKRVGELTNVIGSIKSNWSPNDALYPIPADEFLKNPGLGKQNSGY